MSTYQVERSRLEAVLDAVERVAAGELDASVPVSPARDELDAIAHAINVMAGEREFRCAEVRRTQAAMVRAGRMAALGEVSAGLAHELNNPLAIVRGYFDLVVAILRRDGRPSEEVWRHLDRVDASIERMTTVIRHVRDFSRASTHERAPLSIGAPVRSALLLLREQLRLRSIDVQLDVDETLTVVGSAGRLEQVILNLLANARDAIYEARADAGGVLSVRARPAGIGKVEVVVTDDGVGMTPDVLERAFEPFFTTKDAGRGSGLGLAIARDIVEEHQGTIRVESTHGHGTRVSVLLPRAEATP